ALTAQCPTVERRSPAKALRRLRDNNVALNRVDLHAALLEPRQAPLKRSLVGLHLECHPSVVGLHVGATDVHYDLEVLHQTVDDRLLDQVGRERQAHAETGHGQHRRSGASGDGGDDRHLVGLLEARLLAVEEPDVLLVDVDVDEAPELAALVYQALAQSRELTLEIVHDGGDALALGLYFGGALGERAQRRWNPYQRHAVPPGQVVWDLRFASARSNADSIGRIFTWVSSRS